MGKFIVILDYTNGVTDIIPAPEYDDIENYIDNYIKECYQGCDIHYMICEKLTINL